MVNIYIEGQLIDQFNDENVEVVSQVLDISEIDKVKGDYSKTFTVPASKTNNKIFKHWYNASIDGGFDARTKVNGKIDIDGIPFKIGKFLLHKAKVENGIITNYTINFFGDVTQLKDIIGKDELTDLDLSAYDHDWDDDEVLANLKVDSNDPRPAVIYTLTSRKRYYYDSTFQEDTSYSSESFADAQLRQFNNNEMNIAYSGTDDYADYDDSSESNFAYGVFWRDILPSLRCDKILEAIESKYNLTFSRDFFGTSEFNQLYMLLSSTDGQVVEGAEGRDINWYSTTANSGSDNTYVNPNTERGTFVLSDGDELRLSVNAQTYNVNQVNFINLKLNVNGEFVQNVSGTTSSLNTTGDIPFESDDWTYVNDTGSTQTLVCYYHLVEADGNMDFEWKQTINSNTTKTTLGREAFDGIVSIERNLPKLEIMKFLKGIFQMFKLVLVPQEDGTLYVNTLNSYYTQGTEYEISRYIDRGSLEIERGDLISEISMKYKESDTVLAKQFRFNNGKGYGDAIVRLTDDNGDELEGGSLEFELPFEQVVYERLSDKKNGVITNVHNLSLCEGVAPYSPVNPEPVLHYVNGKRNVNKPILFRGKETGGGVVSSFTKLNEQIFIPTHHMFLTNPFTSLVFDSEFSTWDGSKINNTLYSKNYDNYISSAFDIGRRIYKYTCKLPTIMSANLKLNDVMIVDGIRMRINKFSYNLLTGLSKLELINKIDTSLIPFIGAPATLYVDFTAQQFSFNLPYANEYTISEVNLGDGTTWTNVGVTSDQSRGDQTYNGFFININKRTTGNSYRRVKITFTRDGVTTSMIVLQSPIS